MFRWLHQYGVLVVDPAEKVAQRSAISPLPTVLTPKEYDEAVRIKQQLKKDNFTANIVSRRNEISLGAFRDKSQAERTFTRADGMGLSPRIEPSYANRSTYWLVFGRGDNDDAELAALKKKYPDLHVEIQACP